MATKVKTAVKKKLLLRSAVTGAFRTATFRDEEYLVVPIVALVEGVIWPVNSEKPELVLEEEFAIAPGGWDGRPVFCGHPVRNGEHVSGNSPEVLEDEQIGYVFNSGITDHRLTMEAWISPKMCESAGDAAMNLLERVKAGEPIEISTGVLVVSEEESGSYHGKKYYSIWRDINPDHLALLHEGDEGACSIEMGCGVRAATAHIITAEGIVALVKKKPLVLSEKLKALIKKFRAADAAAAEEVGELIAYSTMSTLLDQAGATLGEAKTLVAGLISDETANPTATAAEEDDEEEIENAKLDALYALAGSSIDTLYKVLSLVSGCLMDDVEDVYPRYMAAAKKDPTTVQAVHDTAVALGATCEGAGMKAASGQGCSCGKRHNQGVAEMKDKATRVAALLSNEHNPLKDKAALEALPDASLEALEAHCKAAKDAADKVVADRASLEGKVNDLIAAAAKPKTEEEYLAAAPASIREVVSKYNAGQSARKVELVAKLNVATVQTAYSEAELQAMSVEQLERIAKVAKVEVASSHIDFSGMSSVPPSSSTTTEAPKAAPAPPDFSAQLRSLGAASMKPSARPQPAAAAAK